MRLATDNVSELLKITKVSLSQMELGDLVVEVTLVEVSPKYQDCLLSDHEHAGVTFHLVQGAKYRMQVQTLPPSRAYPHACLRIYKMHVQRCERSIV